MSSDPRAVVRNLQNKGIGEARRANPHLPEPAIRLVYRLNGIHDQVEDDLAYRGPVRVYRIG